MKVSICIPSYRTLELLQQCIEALEKVETVAATEIVVLAIDADGTHEWASNSPKVATVIYEDPPFYFAEACNRLADVATGDVLLFLNPDTVPRPDFLDHMLREFYNPNCAVVGAKLVYPPMGRTPGAIQHAGVKWEGKYPGPADRPEHIGYMENSAFYSNSYDVQAVTGACMAVRRSVFRELSGFDEKFKNCYEDVDLCIRAREMGYQVRVAGKAEVVHYVSGSMGTDGQHRTSGQFQEEAERRLYQKWSQAKAPEAPVRPFKVVKKNAAGGYINRLLVGTPSTGTVRMEWVLARYGQIIPVNWSQVSMVQFLDPYAPIGYLVADAQNLIVKAAVEGDYEWLFLAEEDNILPEDCFVRLNRYIQEADVPVVSGLYYTKAVPPEPLVFRGRGTSVYKDWKVGDKIWVDGVPTGALLIHMGILRAMWNESPEYVAGDTKTRRVFDTPRKMWADPETHEFNTLSGTSDLDWCTRVIEGRYFEKAGWRDFQSRQYPFLIDSNIWVRHISIDGRVFP